MTRERRAELLTRFAAHSASFDANSQGRGRPSEPEAGERVNIVEPLGTISGRQAEVLQLIAEGLTNHEIAARLFISNETVKTHVVSLLARLGVPNRAAAVAVALRAEFIA
jgi:DNA-binding NarL/FixJ family response regulator